MIIPSVQRGITSVQCFSTVEGIQYIGGDTFSTVRDNISAMKGRLDAAGDGCNIAFVLVWYTNFILGIAFVLVWYTNLAFVLVWYTNFILGIHIYTF